MSHHSAHLERRTNAVNQPYTRTSGDPSIYRVTQQVLTSDDVYDGSRSSWVRVHFGYSGSYAYHV